MAMTGKIDRLALFFGAVLHAIKKGRMCHAVKYANL
jgi:hypothetical protein